MKRAIKSCDMFGFSQFTLYQSNEQYTTLAGGVGSLIIMLTLLAIFLGMAVETFRYTKIVATNQGLFDANPTNYKFTASPTQKFMFAVGIVGGVNLNLDLNLDINLFNTTILSNNVTSLQSNPLELKQCDFSQWEGVSDEVSQAYKQFNLDYFLCPNTDQVMEIEGKYLTEVFKYITIQISQCGTYNKTECQIGGFLDPAYNVKTPTVNLFYINTIVNPNNKDAISYYVEDVNYFQIDGNTTFSANLDFSEYNLITDTSILPWTTKQNKSGISTVGPAIVQSRVRSNYIYGKINFRKSSSRNIIERSFQKITEPLAFVGGLVNLFILAFSILSVYSKYAYEIEFGDRIFKVSEDSTVGSESFNFVVFLQCLIYSMFNKLGVGKSWSSIQKYYQCRMEAVKQLDIHLLFRKIQMFEEVCSTILDEHHLTGLHLLSKKTLKDSRKMRKKYTLRDFIYGYLERLSQYVSIDKDQFAKERQKFLQGYRMEIQGRGKDTPTTSSQMQELQREFAESYQMLEKEKERGEKFSERIMSKLQPIKSDPTLVSLNLNKEQQNEKQQERPNMMGSMNLHSDAVLASKQVEI